MENEIETCISPLANESTVEKRVRKCVSRLSDVLDKTFETKSDKNTKQVVGNGIKLGDIIRFQDACHRSKLNSELAKDIHMICYRTKGKANKRLASIKKFNGFNPEDDSEFSKRVSLLEKMKVEQLRLLCDLFNVHPPGKQKKDIVTGIVEYFKCPFETGSEKFRMNQLKRKVKVGAAKVGTKTVRVRKAVKSVVVTEEEPMEDGDSEMESLSSEDDHEDAPNVPADRTHVLVSVPESSPNKENVDKKRPGPTRKPKISKDDDNEKKPTKSKPRTKNLQETGPTNGAIDATELLSDEMLKEKIAAILSGADLDTTTLNHVCSRVMAQFPDIDLEHKKQHIKSLVKQVLDGASPHAVTNGDR